MKHKPMTLHPYRYLRLHYLRTQRWSRDHWRELAW